MQRELNTQVAVTKDFGQHAPKAVADFSETQRDKYLEQLNNPNLTHEEATAILDEAQKWEEGGTYRVALHTATGLLATGAVEGALTTGGVATIAPKLNEWQDKLTTKLIEKGFEKDTAESVSKFTLNLAIATAGTTAGLDTSSTAYALNTDMNNRQLHKDKGEEWVIEELYKRQGGNKKWSKEQIANALRAADFKKGDFYEHANSNNVVPSGKPELGYDTLVGAKWNNNGTGISLNIPKVDPNLIGYIQSHTEKGDFKSYQYSWDSNKIVGNQQPLPAPRVTRTPPTDYSRSLKAHNTAVMNNPMIVACALNETQFCRDTDQKSMEKIGNMAEFMPPAIAKPVQIITSPLAFLSKAENEGWQSAIVGEAVSQGVDKYTGSKVGAILDEVGFKENIENQLNENLENIHGENDENKK